LPQRAQRPQRFQDEEILNKVRVIGMADSVTGKIISAAIEVHRILGPGLLESIYEEALCYELSKRSMHFERQKDVDVVYKDQVIKGQRLDLFVNGEVVVEIKSVRRLEEIFIAQVLSYLKATGIKRGLIINFGQTRLIDGVKRNSL
jgi:GxxExxY protein